MIFKSRDKPAKKTKKKIFGLKNINEIEKSLEERIFSTSENNRRKERINEITRSRPSIFQKTKKTVIETVINEYHSWGFLHYFVATGLGIVLGWFIGMQLNNIGVSIVLAIVFSTFPYLYLAYKINIVNKDKNEKLLIVMGNIQTAFMMNDSFVLAVKEVLDTIPYPLYPHFKLYVDEVLYFGQEHQVEALERLAKAMNNYYFYEYIQLAIQCEQGEIGLKYTMKSVPLDYKKFLEKNHEYEQIVEDYNIQFILKIVLFPMIIGFIRVVSKEYYDILINHPFGKLILLGVLIGFVVASFIYRKLNKDIKLEL